MTFRKTNNRNGVTLLFVISIIVLFLLMGTTFVIVSNNFLKSAIKHAKLEVKGDRGSALVERAFYDVFRGPELENTRSPLRGHSMLADMYGYGFKAKVKGVPIATSGKGGQFVEFRVTVFNSSLTVTPATEHQQNRRILTGDDDYVLSDTSGFYNGQILSFIDGVAKGMSTRIVDYRVEPNTPSPVLTRTFVVLFDWSKETDIVSDLSQLSGAKIIVNNRVFAGRGAGGLNTGLADAVLGDGALTPNRIGISRATLTSTGGYLAPSSMPNESYDAADFQTIFLAGMDENGDPIPSFYRNTLQEYHKRINSPGGVAQEARFDAFHQSQNRAIGTDDIDLDADGVDTDGDGENDSIWVDINLPVQAGEDGRMYKPLVAYKIVDLDGRLNLNYHGTLADARADHYISTNIPFHNHNPGVGLARGQGYGPPEISLGPLLSSMPGAYLNALTQRYGANGFPGTGGLDVWARYKLFGYSRGAANFTANGTVGHLYGTSAQDVQGRFAVGTPASTDDPNVSTFVNWLPVVDVQDSTWGDERVNSPYEFSSGPSPTGASGDDQPFTFPELERVLRRYDPDAGLLPNRISSLGDLKDLITTESYEVDRLRFETVQKLIDKLTAASVHNTARAAITYIKSEHLLAPELLAGQKMDINRAFGNGHDDNNNNVIDEISESSQLNTDQAGTPPYPLAPQMDLDNQGNGAIGDDMARYDFARQLYIMALLWCRDEPALTQADRIAIAQWAINVVDFRDTDSINTPFEFDLNPWNGWDIDGVIEILPSNGDDSHVERALVFGTERPELLLSESIALHDRRTEDEAKDGQTTDATPDADFDSRLMPNTSAFIEIYNPWKQNSLNQIVPPCLSDAPIGSPKSATGVDLQRTTTSGDPVWRIGIKREIDPDYDRAVYFANVDPINVTDITTWFRTDFTLPAIPPGMHAVIGSSNQKIDIGGGVLGYRTNIGRLLSVSKANEPSNLMLEDTRSITLVPDTNLGSNQVIRFEPSRVRNDYTAIAIPIETPRPLSVSDPTNGYPLVDASGIAAVGIDDGYSYTDPYDVPLDGSLGGRTAADMTAIWTNGLTDGFRILHLQRLANPLEDWHEYQNPYITIDVCPMDLMAFNGVQSDPNNDNLDPGPTVIDPGVPSAGYVIVNGNTRLETFERGESQTVERLLFRADNGAIGEPEATPDLTDLHRLSYDFTETLGRTNDEYVNAANTEPYAWLSWNNRPFASHLEIANVPFSSQQELTSDFGVKTTNNPYEIASAGNEFGHLVNFFGNDTITSQMIDFNRLLEVLETPSRFVGTELHFNPTNFSNNPFNSMSRYRTPGKINLNTIYHEEIWQGLMGSYYSQSAAGISYSEFTSNRKGAQNGVPTDFSNVYRDAGEGEYVPVMDTAHPLITDEDHLVRPEIELGLLRSQNPNAPVATKAPFFNYAPGTQNEYENSNRNAYFRYNLRQRLGNLVTTRSSVFAVWITVGLFEVDENYDLIGQQNELGANSGEVKRHRGFFIVDRSIPVAFEPGKNHNVERAIRVKRIIE